MPSRITTSLDMAVKCRAFFVIIIKSWIGNFMIGKAMKKHREFYNRDVYMSCASTVSIPISLILTYFQRTQQPS